MFQCIENDYKIQQLIIEIWNKFLYLISLKHNPKQNHNIYIK